ncbi:MAG: hypothetical protein KDA44_10805 [Planctomycetales bacterium]|nr:hypothetical protein [Planctomycetales bacterium]
MQYGTFDDQQREFVICTPETPSPWINYLGCEEFFGLMSQTGGGYCFYRDARLRRVLRYRYNNIPADGNGRYFYLRDEADGDFWSLSYMPVRRAVEQFECRHGMGYTTIASRRRGIESELLALVPLGHNAEVHRVTLTNRSDVPRRLKLFSYVEFCLWNALDDMTNFQRNLSTGEVEVVGSTIYHKTEYRERRNHFAYYHVNQPVAGVDTQRDDFVGMYNGLEAPAAVVAGRSRQSLASGGAPIASHALDVELPPGGSQTYVFVLGYAENPEGEKWQAPGVINKVRAAETIDAFATTGQVDAAMAELREHWSALLGQYQLTSSDPRLDRTVNVWNAYQCLVAFNLSRSASYYESGIGRGMGFRDCSQDLLGVVHMVPRRARARILDVAATQLPDGSAYHQYQPLTKQGNAEIGDGFNDDPLWLILAASQYVKETGDYGILAEEVPFDGQRDNSATLLEHLRRSFQYTLDRRGPHGLPLIGRADWNDCLNLNCFSTTPDESFQTTGEAAGPIAESVLIAGMFVYIGQEYADLLQHLNHAESAQDAEAAVADMRAAVLAHGYDGRWFLRAYDHFGGKVGSRDNAEGQIYIESQGFCCMARIGAEEGLCAAALESVGKHLAGTFGIKLLHPPYSKYHPELGEISSYPPGYKENAGIFCHNNPWIIIAEAIHGRGLRAFDYYRRITPAFLQESQQLRRTEPYVYAQMVAGPDAPHSGQAKNSWLTGTASWAYVAATQYLLGIRPEHEGLRISPAIAAEIGPFTVTRKCRGATYVVRVATETEDLRPGLYVEGVYREGDIVPYGRAGEQIAVELVVPVRYGRQAAAVRS